MKLLWKSLWVTNHVALTPLASSGASLGGWSLLFNSHSYAYKKVAQTGIKVRSAFLSSAPKSYFSKSFLAHYSFSSGEATVRKPIWKCVPWIFFPFNFSACKCSAGSVFFFPKIHGWLVVESQRYLGIIMSMVTQRKLWSRMHLRMGKTS